MYGADGDLLANVFLEQCQSTAEGGNAVIRSLNVDVNEGIDESGGGNAGADGAAKEGTLEAGGWVLGAGSHRISHRIGRHCTRKHHGGRCSLLVV